MMRKCLFLFIFWLISVHRPQDVTNQLQEPAQTHIPSPWATWILWDYQYSIKKGLGYTWKRVVELLSCTLSLNHFIAMGSEGNTSLFFLLLSLSFPLSSSPSAFPITNKRLSWDIDRVNDIVFIFVSWSDFFSFYYLFHCGQGFPTLSGVWIAMTSQPVDRSLANQPLYQPCDTQTCLVQTMPSWNGYLHQPLFQLSLIIRFNSA